MIASAVTKLLKIFLDLIELVFIGAVVSFFVFFYVAQPLKVTGDSMVPTFEDQEQIIAEKLSIKTQGLQRGDIIIFRHPDNEEIFIIKRLIGFPGEIIEIKNGKVHIDGRVLNERYLYEGTQTKGFGKIPEEEEVLIPEGAYALLGDNRDNSSDSRTWGFITEDLIVGKSFIVYFPFGNWRLTTQEIKYF